MDVGFRRQGFSPILAIDSDQSAIDTYNRNDRRKVGVRRDIRELSDTTIIELVKSSSPGIAPRGVIGGPPCQSFSVGNVNKKHRDPRAMLGQEYARVLKALNTAFTLDFFVFENVLGLKARRHKRRLNLIIRALEGAGFNVFQQEMDASEVGVAQRRRRLFIIGINSSKFPEFKLILPERTATKPPTVRDALGHLPAPTFFRRDLGTRKHPVHPNHWAMNPRSTKFSSGQGFNGRSFRKLEWRKPSWTVAYGNREVHVHPSGTRRLSVYEAMLLQGFPKSYELRGTFSQQVSQVSDAVPPPLAAAVAKTIRESVYNRIGKIRQELLRWFEKHERSLPWRATTDPFSILIAEKLLQQTAASDVVVNAYTELNRRYVTPQELAIAPLQTLRKIIAPLGLHYRATELKRLAKTIASKHGGIVPSEFSALMELPGVGEYCARSVLVFGFGQDVTVVDTNVARFLYRVFGIRGDLPKNPARSAKLSRLAETIMPKGRARDFNLAILDLCASICTSSQPKCQVCPVRRECTFSVSRTNVAQSRESHRSNPVR